MLALKHVVIMGAIATGIISPASVHANLVVNGDFEQPNLGGTFPDFIPAGSTAVTGWTIGGGNVTVHQVSANQPYWNPPHNSSQWMDLTGNSGGAYIEQTILTTPGAEYLLTFDTFNGSLSYSGNNPQPTGFKVEAIGSLAEDVTVTPGSAAFESFIFKATDSSTTVRFTDLTGFDSNAGWIDNVSVSAVPEPTTLIAGALLLLPFGASTLRIIRRNKIA